MPMADETVIVFRCGDEEGAEAIASALLHFPPIMRVRTEVRDDCLIIYCPEALADAIAETVLSASESAGSPVEQLVQVDADECDGWWGGNMGEA